ASCVHGLTELFALAAKAASDRSMARLASVRITHWQAAAGNHSLVRVYDSTPLATPGARILVIPPSLTNSSDTDFSADVVPWLKSQHVGGATLISVSSGAFILAQTGLVDGRTVATHRACADALAQRFPRIVVEANRGIIDDGDIITAGGFLAWVDVGLL